MGALELSIDKDWLRIKGAAFIASGDGDPFDDKGRGFDAIVDIPAFAGGPFSLWNRQGLRLAQTGTGLKSPVSLLPTLRTNKDEGQRELRQPRRLHPERRRGLRADAQAARLRHDQLRPVPGDRADGSAALPGEGPARTSASSSAAAPRTARR